MIIFFLVIFCASILGTATGLGGGVMIKPLLDLLTVHDTATVSFYSSLAVFTMCLISVFKQIKSGVTYQKNIALFFSLGSILGGYIGEVFFNQILKYATNENTVRLVQSIGLCVSFSAILIYTLHKHKFKTYHISSPFLITLIGLVLGLISVFLGIGGGPLNIVVLTLFFSLSMKESVIYSLLNITFSQLAKLGPMAVSGVYKNFDGSVIPILIISSIVGGYLGTLASSSLKESHVENACRYILVFLICMTGYNIFRYI